MTLRNLALWITGIVIITAAVILTGFDELAVSLKQVSISALFILFILQVFTLLIAALQWHYLLKKLEQKLSFMLVFVITLVGNYIESVTPAVKLGGEAAKVYLFHQHTSLGYDRLAGILIALKYFSMLPFVCLAVIFSGSAFINYNLPLPVLGAFAFLFIFFAAIAYLYYRGGGARAREFSKHPSESLPAGIKMNDRHHDNVIGRLKATLEAKLGRLGDFVKRAASFSRGITNRRESIALISASTLVWILYPVKVLLVTRILGLEAGFLPVVIITFTAYLISMVPLLPGGLGSFEATMALMFSLHGFSLAEGLSVALLSRLVTFWFPLLLSALGASYLGFLKASKTKESRYETALESQKAGSKI